MANIRIAHRLSLVFMCLAACHSQPLGDAQPDGPLQPEANANGGASAGATSANGGRTDEPGAGRAGREASAGGAPGGGSSGNVETASGAPPAEPGGGEGGSAEPLGPFEVSARCSSGMYRLPSEVEGPTMDPGLSCITCHAIENAGSSESNAPILSFAGTVYPTGHEPSTCMGMAAENAEIVLKDASGAEWRAVANTSGNFLSDDARLVPPFSVKVSFDGKERVAATPHTNGDCNSCHTEAGDQGAPGRIVLP